ncbi:geranylgeranylglycerol-phosphate geranylgeranyltransferase [bacterium]|nr:geranylgeranylglycerol-phosphate geranylgeranyltransferase [bacterium]
MSDTPTATRTPLAATISLARPANGAIAFAGTAAACVIAGARMADWLPILLAACAAFMAGAAGNMINDVYDIAIDRVNKPWRALAAQQLRPATAALLSALSGCAALALSIPLGSTALLIMGCSLVAMFMYSAWLKRIPLLGNALVAVLTGAAFLYGAAAFDNPAAGLVPAGFALLFNFAREVLKDVEDMRGDSAAAVMTFPLRAGESAALRLVTVILVLLIASTLLPIYFHLYGAVYGWVVIFGVDSVLCFVLYAMWKDRSTANIRRLNILLKIDMPAGIAAILLGSLYP